MGGILFSIGLLIHFYGDAKPNLQYFSDECATDFGLKPKLSRYIGAPTPMKCAVNDRCMLEILIL
jgi:hypothetical protein